MLDWLSQNWLAVYAAVLSLSVGASAALHVLAPLTKTQADDKAAAKLDWLISLLKKLSLNKSGV